MLVAFHNDPKIKDKYIARVKAHKAADEIIHGKYVQKYGKGQIKGCAVGCTLHSDDHGAYETELGIPRILARLEDGIFESLNSPRDTEWPLQFLEATPVGADLSNVWPQFAAWMLVDKEWGVIQFAKTDRTKKAIQAIAEFYQSGKFAKKEHWNEIDKLRIEVRASAAAYTAAAAAAADAAYAAADADAAYADAAAVAAAVAAAAAAAVADAAAAAAAAVADAAAAADAARQKWRNAQADKLLELMSEAPVLEAVK
jgi:hypothetical protein